MKEGCSLNLQNLSFLRINMVQNSYEMGQYWCGKGKKYLHLTTPISYNYLKNNDIMSKAKLIWKAVSWLGTSLKEITAKSMKDCKFLPVADFAPWVI